MPAFHWALSYARRRESSTLALHMRVLTPLFLDPHERASFLKSQITGEIIGLQRLAKLDFSSKYDPFLA